MTLKETFLRIISNFDHYGRCQRCRISWEYREHMTPLPYHGENAAFPLCQQCFDEVDADEATEHFKDLWWGTWVPIWEDLNIDPDRDAEESFEAFRESARKKKNGELEGYYDPFR